MKLEFTNQVFEKETQISCLITIHPVEPSCFMRTDGRKEIQTEANRRLKTASVSASLKFNPSESSRAQTAMGLISLSFICRNRPEVFCKDCKLSTYVLRASI